MRTLAALLLLSSACLAQSGAPTAGYHQHQVIEVRDPGATGRLEMLEDERITSATRAAVVSAHGESPCREARDPSVTELCAAIERLPLRPAIVRLVRGSGEELGRLVLERATGDLSRLALSPRDSAFAVNIDLSADAGSYNGPVVRLLNVSDRLLAWVQVVDDATGRSSELDLPTTLKTAWRIVPDAERPEILLVACRPDFDHPTGNDRVGAFAITYSRIDLVNGRWHRTDRRVAGIWENDGAFPERTLFP